MSKVPSLNYDKVIKALQRDGWVVVRQKGSHIRLHKYTKDKKGLSTLLCKFHYSLSSNKIESWA